MVLVTLTASAMSMRLVSGNSLTIEQVPKFRGTMMSLNQAVISTGQFLGTAIGGLLILLHGYEVAGIVMGALGLVAVAVFSLFVVDPTRKLLPQHQS
jgi:predicted MFS family arabinose efflux permease